MSIGLTSSGVTTPQGFRAAGIGAGIKRANPSGAPLDLALLVSDVPATAAAVFTTNRAQAAPVLGSLEHLERSHGIVRAIVVNSVCANACTGDDGMLVARGMAEETARLVGCPIEQVLVASTRRHRCFAPIENIETPCRSRSPPGGSQSTAAARAIMTTDPFPKEAAVGSDDRRPHRQPRHGQTPAMSR